jgi:demethylmenaquinone methyltransferase/2-methoxy-6-polyprenyl-1,4-benzoquinol methylase
MVIPYKDTQDSKKSQVQQMFDNIAFRYDFLNHFLSMGIDNFWRRKAISKIKHIKTGTVLDVATGTGDLAITTAKRTKLDIVGIDLSENMLSIGREKIIKKGFAQRIKLQQGDSESIQFPDANFEAITVAFGVRNFENLDKGLSEMYRVLKPGGKVVVLEFSKPKYFPVKQIYYFYFRKILPFIGRFISKDRAAYTYLPESVESFPDGKNFLVHLSNVGFVENTCKSMTFGIVNLYTGSKN